MLRYLMSPMVYRGISHVITPAAKLWLLHRRNIGKEPSERIGERFGCASRQRPKGILIWAHAASIGETLSILPISRKLEEKGFNILITSGTVTSANVLETRLPKNITHQFIPVDLPFSVKRFLNHWQPNLAMFVESEFWPNLILETTSRSIPMVLVNARMSEKSARRWKSMPKLISPLLESFSSILAQSEMDGERLKSIGGKNIQIGGNIKYDAPPLSADKDSSITLLNYLGSRPCWLAASTHIGDEILVADAHQKLSAKFPELLTLIAPRHPNRAKAIGEILQSRGLSCAFRSKGNKINTDTDIYIADTLGEMGLLYTVLEIVLIAGSFDKHGGHNPIEPALLNNALLAGPDMKNFEDACISLEGAGALSRVCHNEDLIKALETLLKDSDLRKQRAKLALEIAQTFGGASNTAFEVILDHLKLAGSKDENA